MRRWVVLAASLLATSSAAAAQREAETDWLSRPTQQEIAAIMPAAAKAIGWRVVLRCKADLQGTISDCAPVAESSGASGAAQALLSVVPKYRLKPERVTAAAPGGEISIVESWFHIDTPPDWRRRPTSDQLRVVWPTEAWARGRDGSARIGCLISTAGSLYDCLVVRESPAGLHFGQAALALTPQFLMWPAKLHGQPVVSEIEIPLNFKGAGGGGHDIVEARPVIMPAISWTEAPTLADMADAYPAQARATGAAGFASVQCGFGRDGRVRDCAVMREEPRQLGFGAAAKTLAARFRLDPAEVTDVKINSARVSLPFAFEPGLLQQKSIGKPIWTHTPDFEALRTAFLTLKASSPSGRAVIDCQVRQGGRLEGCKLDSEIPSGSGLGQTALALQGSFRVATWSDQGLPVVGGSIHVPIRFNFDEPPAGPAQTPPPKP